MRSWAVARTIGSYQFAADYSRSVNDWRSEAGACLAIGNARKHLNDFVEARRVLVRASEVLPSDVASYVHLHVFYALGQWCFASGNHTEAILRTEQALACAERLNDPTGRSFLVKVSRKWRAQLRSTIAVCDTPRERWMKRVASAAQMMFCATWRSLLMAL
jgi:hypothetical protein